MDHSNYAYVYIPYDIYSIAKKKSTRKEENFFFIN